MFAELLDPISVVAVSTDPAAQPGRLADGAVVSWLAKTDTFRAVHILVPPRVLDEQLDLTADWWITTVHDSPEFADTVMADRCEHLRAKNIPVRFETGATTPAIHGAAGSPTTRSRTDNVVLTRFADVRPGDRFITARGTVSTATRCYTFDDITTVYTGGTVADLGYGAGYGVDSTFTAKHHHLVGRVGNDPATVWTEEKVREGRSKFGVARWVTA